MDGCVVSDRSIRARETDGTTEMAQRGRRDGQVGKVG